MHFSIPSTQELKEENSSTYTGFNLHVNGVLHCTVRYSQLFDLNERLKQEFGADALPAFPPKRLFAVKGSELEDRKMQLEKYVQDLCQNLEITNSEIFATFLSRAQQETQLEESAPVNFQIFLMNGSKLKINVQSTDKTNKILEYVMAALGINEELTYYFGLFLVESKENQEFWLVRQMQEFECPYLSLKSTHNPKSFKVVLRKVYWDQTFDQTVLKDKIGLNLLYVQAESDLLLGWTKCDDESKKRLNSLKKRGSKREFVEFSQTLQHYGYLQLESCLVDYPEENTPATISVGNYELVLKLTLKDKSVKEETFSVTRIKGWRVCTIFRRIEGRQVPTGLLLCFEYLVRKGHLIWIKVQSDQSIILSMSIKSMVEELLRKKKGEKIKKPNDFKTNGQKQSYKPRDKSTEVLFDPSEVDLHGVDGSTNIQKAKDSVKKLSDMLTVSSLTAKSSVTEENQVNQGKVETTFENIGDDDL